MKDVDTSAISEDIQRLKKEMWKLEQAELPTEHYWCDGMYLRLVARPATCTIVGKVHKKPHFYVVMKGKVTIVGVGERKTVEAPYVAICEPGTQKAVYAHEDSICFTVHRTDKTDMAELEAELAEPDPDSPYLPGNILKPKLLK